MILVVLFSNYTPSGNIVNELMKSHKSAHISPKYVHFSDHTNFTSTSQLWSLVAIKAKAGYIANKLYLLATTCR